MTQYVTTVKQDSEIGDLFMDIPDELIDQLGWQPGDIVMWTLRDDGSITIHRKDKPTG